MMSWAVTGVINMQDMCEIKTHPLSKHITCTALHILPQTQV